MSFTGSTAGGALSAAVTGGPAVYNVAVSGMTSGGTVVASIPPDSAADAASNPNTASTSTDNSVTWAADLTVTKINSPDPVVTGQDITYTITVTWRHSGRRVP